MAFFFTLPWKYRTSSWFVRYILISTDSVSHISKSHPILYDYCIQLGQINSCVKVRGWSNDRFCTNLMLALFKYNTYTVCHTVGAPGWAREIILRLNFFLVPSVLSQTWVMQTKGWIGQYKSGHNWDYFSMLPLPPVKMSWLPCT